MFFKQLVREIFDSDFDFLPVGIQLPWCSRSPVLPQSMSSTCNYSCSVLVERGILILVLPQSPTSAVDVRIYYANRTTAGLREEFFMVDTVFSGPGILQFSQASGLNFCNEQSHLLTLCTLF